ncbi:hypothetical protein T01_6869 [Trichinella spiralis]|uniref:Uncharacterized protein n=1 Tax=Trichinella spiralis TaxID=6334 RepID=A0A0V1AUM4_TRISP|nr:hypothetical protein T01_6869 [Trichinella spiralis]
MSVAFVSGNTSIAAAAAASFNEYFPRTAAHIDKKRHRMCTNVPNELNDFFFQQSGLIIIIIKSATSDSILRRLMHLAQVSYQLYGLQSLKFGYGSFEKIVSQNILLTTE